MTRVSGTVTRVSGTVTRVLISHYTSKKGRTKTTSVYSLHCLDGADRVFRLLRCRGMFNYLNLEQINVHLPLYLAINLTL